MDQPPPPPPKKTVKSLTEILASKSNTNSQKGRDDDEFPSPPVNPPSSLPSTFEPARFEENVPKNFLNPTDDQEYDFIQNDEMEMPSSSTVLHDDSDILMLLAGGNQNAQQSIPQQLINSQSPVNGSFSKEKEDLIELYSTITLLKKENQELTKDLEYTKKSKDALLKDQQQKYEMTISKLKNELFQLQERVSIYDAEKFESLRIHDQMKEDYQVLVHEKDDLEQRYFKLKEKEMSLSTSNSNSEIVQNLRSEVHSLKSENNKLKMEISRIKADSEKSNSHEIFAIKEELQQKNIEIEDLRHSQQLEIDSLRQELKRAEEQLTHYRNESSEKTQQITKITTDFMKLDRQYIAANNENNNLKQKLLVNENRDRELQDTKYRLQMIDNDFYELQRENNSLKSQIQSLQERMTSSSLSHQSHFSSHNSSNYHRQPVHDAPPSYSSNSNPRHEYNYSVPSHNSAASSFVNHNSYDNNFSNPPPQSRSSAKSLSSALGDASELRKSYHPPDPVAPVNNRMAPPPGGSNRGEGSSLLNVLQGRKQADPYESAMNNRRNNTSSGLTPFATDITNVAVMQGWEQFDRDLTQYMTEKHSLQDESEKLHQRGLKTLKDRTRLQQVESRLNEVNKEISGLRMKLSSKPA